MKNIYTNVIVLGGPGSGKTTLLNKIRRNLDNSAIKVSEMDEEIIRLNNGIWPGDTDFRNKTILPKVINGVINDRNVIFFTQWFPLKEIEDRLKTKVIQLWADENVMLQRFIGRYPELKENLYEAIKRVKCDLVLENYDFQKKAREDKLVDKVIDVSQTQDIVYQEFLEYCSFNK